MAAKSKHSRKPNRPRTAPSLRQGPTNKQAKRQTYKQLQIEAAAAARRRSHRKRQLTTLGVIAAVAVIITGVVLFTGGNDKKNVASTDSSTTVAGALDSAAGKPCVAVADPLPAGAPAVPVEVGPPPTTLVSRDLKVGDGAVVAATSTLNVQYIGVSCSTGKIFDSSWSRGQPASFALSGVIPGWQQGLVGMKVGGQRLLGIPSNLAYQDQGSPPDIAPNEALWFVVDLLGVT